MMLLFYSFLGCAGQLLPVPQVSGAAPDVVLLDDVDFRRHVAPVSPIPECANGDVFVVDGASSSIIRLDGTLKHAQAIWQLPKGALIAGARLISEQHLVIFENDWAFVDSFAVRILDVETSAVRTVRFPVPLERRILHEGGVKYLNVAVQPDGTVIQECEERICVLSIEGSDWQNIEAPKSFVVDHAMAPTVISSSEIALVGSVGSSLRITSGNIGCKPLLAEARSWSGPSGQYLVVAGPMVCNGEEDSRIELYDTSADPWSLLLGAPVEGLDIVSDLGFVWDPATSRPSGVWLTRLDRSSDLERLDLVQLGSTQVTELSGLLPDDPTRMWVGGLCGTRAGVRVVGGVGSLVYSAEVTSRGLKPRGYEVYRGPGGVATLQADQALRRAQRARGTHMIGFDP